MVSTVVYLLFAICDNGVFGENADEPHTIEAKTVCGRNLIVAQLSIYIRMYKQVFKFNIEIVFALAYDVLSKNEQKIEFPTFVIGVIVSGCDVLLLTYFIALLICSVNDTHEKGDKFEPDPISILLDCS